MNKNRVHNIYAALLIIGIIAAVFVRVWAAGREASVTGPTAVRIDANGNAYIISANILYIHDKDGDLVDRIPLGKMGIDRFVGDFWVFKNGDLLLRRDVRQEPSFLGDIGMFFRGGPGNEDTIAGEEGILQRCRLATLRCESFGTGPDAFKKTATFKLAADEEKGQVYIADTLEHRLLLYDLQGALKGKSEALFRFPNGLLPSNDGLLYVADTNNHRICGVSTGAEHFGRIEKTINLTTGGVSGGRAWPSAILPVKDERWMVVDSSGVQYGAVALYDRDGAFVKRIDIPDGADPMSLAAIGDRVLITDPSGMRVYRVSLDKGMEEDFGSFSMTIDLHELKRTRNLYALYKQVFLGVLIGLLVLTLVVVIKSRRQNKGAALPRGNEVPASRQVVNRAPVEQDTPAERSLLTGSATGNDETREPAPEYSGGRMHDREFPEQPRELRLQFHGSAREYFRIWIVNLCLTLVTFGIFSAWAKVRKKRYFYSNTTLDNTPFQYLGQPVPILKGRVIAAAAFSVYYLATHFITSLLPYVFVAGLVLAPWVIVRSAAFHSRYSAYRNMTFQFKAGYLDALKAIYLWGLIPILVVGSIFNWWGQPALGGICFAVFGFSFPWWLSRFKNFIVSSTSYGGKEGVFSAKGGQFFKVYSRAGLITVGVAILSGILVAVLASSVTKKPQLLVPLFAIPFYAGYVFAYGYMQAQSGNLVWNHTQLGPLRFQSTLRGRDLAKLYISNALGIIASLGLLTPWAVIRTLKYRAENLLVVREGELTEFSGGRADSVRAAGAETMDFFDMDISL